jgi:hypothetical protein
MNILFCLAFEVDLLRLIISNPRIAVFKILADSSAAFLRVSLFGKKPVEVSNDK